MQTQPDTNPHTDTDTDRQRERNIQTDLGEWIVPGVGVGPIQ